jgi:ketosteroid isomerase-like protein
MAQVTPELVQQAYDALASGDMEKIRQCWAEDMIWLVPGHNPISGLKRGLDGFLGFMAEVGRLSGNSFYMDREAIMVSENASADVTHNVGNRAGDVNRKLDINVIHYLRWRDGKVIEGRGAIFGDGTAQYDAFWS